MAFPPCARPRPAPQVLFPDPETASLYSGEKAAREVRLPTATHPANQCEEPPKPGCLESQLCGQRLPNHAEPPFPCKETTSLPRKISLFILLGSPQAHGQGGWQRVGSAESLTPSAQCLWLWGGSAPRQAGVAGGVGVPKPCCRRPWNGGKGVALSQEGSRSLGLAPSSAGTRAPLPGSDAQWACA